MAPLFSAFVIALLGLALPVRAAPISASFSGTFTEITDPEGLLTPEIGIGVPFTISYTMETDSFERTCYYSYSCQFRINPVDAFEASVAIGSRVFTEAEWDVAYVFIGDGLPVGETRDSWTLSFTLSVEPAPVAAAQLEFIDNTDSRVTDPSLYFVNETLEGWEGGTFSIIVLDTATTHRADGPIAPEPTTLVLVGLGMVALAGVRRLSGRQ